MLAYKIECLQNNYSVNHKDITVVNKESLLFEFLNFQGKGGNSCGTVSYTHLDVYKRQVLLLSISMTSS